ncbi:MAG TPA: thioredoxin domain-containing protein [Chitinophagaceae bacterium]|nr:thioredoxin domain-containing protein [Chitinophagaceae bacterium]
MTGTGNQLIHETSPYLLQHAHNPVDWHPWGEKALEKAKQENKPILVSIGYSACHWCHVMEKESFEDEKVAAFMNRHFINIKIDREERPDLDHIYMDAVQAMTGSGGWPLNVFLTPDTRPFYGGTYYPPQKAFNRPSWMDILQGVAQAFEEKRAEIDEQAENLTAHLRQSNAFGIQAPGQADYFQLEKLDEIFENIMKQADQEWGGFGRAPKFPQTFIIQFLLRYKYVNDLQRPDYSRKANIEKAALLSLDKMIQGGIYDQVGGGFARYSTDTEWLVPHFEKMLYDNALLISVLSEAYQLTHKELYRETISDTIGFIERELMHFQKGFYSALDADSEGVEGKFYVWNWEEVKAVLKEDSMLFSSYYGISEKGNWEGNNILHIPISEEEFTRTNNVDLTRLKTILQNGKQKLLAAREKRIRPGLDDKILLGWNALMNTALCKAYAATGHEPYRQLALDNMRFIVESFAGKQEGSFYHTWKNGQAKYPAFLDDYAYLVEALLHIQEISADPSWLSKARVITEYVISQFSEEDTGFFFYTGKDQKDIVIRKKEVYDGATPSGNAVMAYNLCQLSLLLDKPEWGNRGRDMVSSLGSAITKYPTSFGNWACLYQEIVAGTLEIVVLGKAPTPVHNELLARYIPHRVMMVSTAPGEWPLLSGKPLHTKTKLWLCKNYSCREPVDSVDELIALINSPEAAN